MHQDSPALPRLRTAARAAFSTAAACAVFAVLNLPSLLTGPM